MCGRIPRGAWLDGWCAGGQSPSMVESHCMRLRRFDVGQAAPVVLGSSATPSAAVVPRKLQSTPWPMTGCATVLRLCKHVAQTAHVCFPAPSLGHGSADLSLRGKQPGTVSTPVSLPSKGYLQYLCTVTGLSPVACLVRKHAAGPLVRVVKFTGSKVLKCVRFIL